MARVQRASFGLPSLWIPSVQWTRDKCANGDDGASLLRAKNTSCSLRGEVETTRSFAGDLSKESSTRLGRRRRLHDEGSHCVAGITLLVSSEGEADVEARERRGSPIEYRLAVSD